mmetsp:Transcript_112069/g.217161  ORF Transcript_112069/g.217161 Transcript_112069/m.217161 type:complete len:415 (-) Transcript_112069:42-1286(-)
MEDLESSRESSPLLTRSARTRRRSWWPFGSDLDHDSHWFNVDDEFLDKAEEDEWDNTCYDIKQITSWRAFGMVKGCAWDNPSILHCMVNSAIVSTLSSLLVFFKGDLVLFTPDSVQQLGVFLSRFVSLLLGFFLAQSMNWWHRCVREFLKLLDSVRSMQMQMTALGVRKDRADTIGRYGVMSAWLLHFHLTLDSEDGQGDVDLKDMWKKLDMVRPSICLPKEKVMLSQYPEPYALLWTWVASLVGRMAVDSEIPAMASPTYGRILDLVSNAFSSIREVRALYAVKVPFIYLHTLAVLVHVNNILNAVSFGLTLGSAFTQSVEIEDEEVEPIRMSSRRRVKVWTMLCMQFCFSMIAPMLYLALLEVCVCISQPFRYKDARIPAVRLIRALEEDLKNAAAVADRPPDWEKPMFKVP